MPSRALRAGSGPVARGLGPLALLDPLPLAVDVRRGPGLGLAEHVRVAPDDLARDRRPHVGHVERALLRRELRVEHDLEQQVAELPGELGRRARPERVVDLVRLLQQVVAQRLVGLLLVPRAAVGRAQPVRDPGHAPGRGDVRDRARRARGTAAPARSSAVSAPTVVPSGSPNRPTAWSARVEAAEDGDGVAPARRRAARGAAAARQPHRSGAPARSRAAGTSEHGQGRLERRGDQPFGDDDREARRGIEPEAVPGLGEERVQHRPPAPPASGRRGLRDVPGDRVASPSPSRTSRRTRSSRACRAARRRARGSPPCSRGTGRSRRPRS